MPVPEPLQPGQVRRWRCTNAGLLVFSDFDGTLVPLRNDPHECQLDAEGQRLLSALAAQPDCLVAVVSGRLLSDLRPRVGVPGIGYAGNHGLEIELPGQAFREPQAVQGRPELARLVEALRPALADLPGAWVQDKELTLSVHYRLVAPEQVATVMERVEEVCQAVVRAGRFLLRSGKKVLELRPAVQWNKGSATQWIAERSGLPSPQQVVYLGDDETDEDAFRAWPEGLTIRVGGPAESRARWRLDGPAQVLALLQEILDCCGKPEESLPRSRDVDQVLRTKER